ncbi:MAG: hypothetical protein LJE97_09885 [Betaproteobacteria bacterium]|nr:hypothetical protein [Betaproteobacteria bacterium]
MTGNTKSIRDIAALLVTGAVFVMAAGVAHAQSPRSDMPAVGEARRVVVTGTIEAVDRARRVLSVRGSRGNVVDIHAGPEVRNFDQIQAGDTVAVRYYQAIGLALDKTANSGIRERIDTETAVRAPEGARPGVAAGRKVEVIADVQAVDLKNRTVTLRGVRHTVTLSVAPGIKLENIKPGDQVHGEYVEAAAVSVEETR